MAGYVAWMLALSLGSLATGALAQAWSAEQLEVWKVEERQWAMSAAKDRSWIDVLVHPNVSYWETGEVAPANKASLVRWNRFEANGSTTVEYELFPLAITVTGNVAVVQYRYKIGRENEKKERSIATGRYSDVLVKEDGRWRYLSWSGGEDAKP